jgi:tyrosine-protein phosphatase SIW14
MVKRKTARIVIDHIKRSKRSQGGRLLLSFALLFVLLLAVNAVRTAADPPLPIEEARLSERIFGLKGLTNVGRVAPNVYRGAQPLPEGYTTLKKMGIRTVINLRTAASEKRAVEAAGMKSVEIPLSVWTDVSPKTIDGIIDIMRDPANQPVFLHCRQGRDRTGIVVAAYRMKVDGWSFAEAEAEMQSFGFNDIWHELKESIREYAKKLGK